MVQLFMKAICGGADLYVKRGKVWYIYVDLDEIIEIIEILKLSSLFRMQGLADITCTDLLDRYEITYTIFSYLYSDRLNLRICVEYNSFIWSLYPIFRGADWLEREIWDMFGLFSFGHGDIRRILTDYGFDGHPLLKTFPLVGYYEVRYDEVEKRVVMEGVSLMQELRVFEFIRSWT